MARQLRPRSVKNYEALLRYEDEDTAEIRNEPGPSQPPIAAYDEEDSGSDFAPPPAAEEADNVSEDEIMDDEEEMKLIEEGDKIQVDGDEEVASVGPIPVVPAAPKGRGGRGRGGISKVPSKESSAVNIGIGRNTRLAPKNHSLPALSVHHRHKAIPIFHRHGRVERLVRPPILFGENETVPTNSYTSSRVTTGKLNRAWGYNVGSGPLWDLCEDRGWFKEEREANEDGGEWWDGNRRPRVCEELHMPEGWAILDERAAAPYLPSDSMYAEQGELQPSPPVECSFGPFGKQKLLKMKALDTLRLSELMPESRSHVFNAGAPVFALDWCPIHAKDRLNVGYKQYLAVGPLPNAAHAPDVGTKVIRPSPACVQIWSLGPTQPIGSSASKDDRGEMRCAMVLCVDCGPAYTLKWCPLPSHDEMSGTATDRSQPRKLGLLAGAFEDGTVSIFIVPYPLDLRDPARPDSGPVYVKLSEPLLRIEMEDTSCWTLDWANSESIVVGCTNGAIAVYDISTALRTRNSDNCLLPTHYILNHQAGVRALSWIRVPATTPDGEPLASENPTVIASGGYDGVECLTDIRELSGHIMNRTRDVIPCMPYSPFAGGPITIDHENIVKAYSASPSMLGRGHTLLEPNGPVWTAATSDFHPQLAIGSADGTLSTTNMLRSTRRGGLVPFLMHKIYQLDYSRATHTYRMLDRFYPQETPDRSSTTSRAYKGAQTPEFGTGAWPVNIGVLQAAWHSGGGLGAASLLASSTASGLCRVDYLPGRWVNEKLPYGGVEGIRGEVEGMDIDEDEDSS